MVEGVLQRTEEGTPQGGPASPLLANILLDDLDKELERRGLPFVRYADDFAIFAKSERAARADHGLGHALSHEDICDWWSTKTKSRIVSCDQFEYLGFSFAGQRATINVSEKIDPEIQTPHPRDDRPKSRHLDGPPAERAAKLCARMDGILRLGIAIETVRSSLTSGFVAASGCATGNNGGDRNAAAKC